MVVQRLTLRWRVGGEGFVFVACGKSLCTKSSIVTEKMVVLPCLPHAEAGRAKAGADGRDAYT